LVWTKALIKTSDFNTIMDLASKGDLSRVDLMIKDIADTDISFLAKDMTASNFAKMLESANKRRHRNGHYKYGVPSNRNALCICSAE